MDPMHGPVVDRTDDEDFVAFVNARWAALYRFAWLLTGGQESAEDLLQLALEKTYVKWGRIRRMDAPEAYVRRVLANTAISQSRRSFMHHEVNQPELPDHGSASFEEGSDSRSLLWPLVCALPPRQRAVVVLRFYEDLTEAQVAQELGCSVGTAQRADPTPRSQLISSSVPRPSAFTYRTSCARSASTTGCRRPHGPIKSALPKGRPGEAQLLERPSTHRSRGPSIRKPRVMVRLPTG